MSKYVVCGYKAAEATQPQVITCHEMVERLVGPGENKYSGGMTQMIILTPYKIAYHSEKLMHMAHHLSVVL